MPSVYLYAMKGGHEPMHKRINVTLPESTVRLMERVASKGERSRLVDQAVRQYLRGVTKKSLRGRLKEGALRHSERDRAIAEEWLLLDEIWPKGRR
jgi:CopG family transcriptional regulator / antitoxin EndoAI